MTTTALKTAPVRWCSACREHHPNTDHFWHASVLSGRSDNTWCREAHRRYYLRRRAELTARRRDRGRELRSMSAFELNAVIRAKRAAGEPVPAVLIDRLGIEVARLQAAFKV